MSVTMRFVCLGGGPECPVPPMRAAFVGADPVPLACTHCQFHTHTIVASSHEEGKRIWREQVRSWGDSPQVDRA